MGEKRACAGTTKAGKPCRAPALKDTGYCMVHGPEEVRESKGFGGPQEGAGRPRTPRVVDVLRERIERDIDKWLKVYEDALGASRPLGVGSGEDFHVVDVEDHATRLRALADAFDRAFGKPKQATELSGPDGAPVQVEGDAPDLGKLSPEQLKTYLALVKAMRGDGGEQ